MNTRINFIILYLLGWCSIWAQPVNDECANAYPLEFANSEAEALLANGDTRGATASTTPTSVCSQSFYTDDIWYAFTTPADLSDDGIVIKAYFDTLMNSTDLPHVGMAVYKGCATEESFVACYVTDDPELNSLELSGVCLAADQDYLIRIWSGGSDSTTEGTFRIGVFANPAQEEVLWWETFGGGLESNGWTTEGTCALADSNANAGWKYLPDGRIDKGAYIFTGAAINSLTLCDGAIGVDSDYNDNRGTEGFGATGPCPTPGHHLLTSPSIYCGEWQVAGLSVTWTQAIRNFQSTHFFAYRIRDADSDWSEWMEREINTEYEINGNFLNREIQRFPLPGAVGHDSLQVRFTYNDNYYLWAIDDIKIIAQECTNSKISRFHAIPPFAQIPSYQSQPFPALADIYNVGACPLTNSVLKCSVVDIHTLDTIYADSLSFGTLASDSTLLRRILPSLIDLPEYSGDFLLRYSLFQDSFDFDPFDNEISIPFSTGGNVFALESGFTRSISVSNGAYNLGAPLSYAYGNYYRPVHNTGVLEILWGASNPEDMEGKTVQIYLLQWTDLNGNQFAEAAEREFIGVADYTFTGSEGANVILSSTLEHFTNPGEAVVMEGGKGYIAIIEYQATSTEDPQFFMLASEARDYTPQQLASDSAYAQGLTDMPSYFSVLGWSPDGVITNIGYEVKEFDPTDNRMFFGNDIVPVVRIVTYDVDTMSNSQSTQSVTSTTVFPNPANEKLSVKIAFSNQPQNVQLHLINSKGQRLATRAIRTSSIDQTETFDVRHLAAGSYHLQIETAAGQRTIPVVILH